MSLVAIIKIAVVLFYSALFCALMVSARQKRTDEDHPDELGAC